MPKFWNLKANDAQDVLDINVHGDIVTDSGWFGSEDDVICRDFISAVNHYKDAKRINVYINSGGGEVFAAVTMAQTLKHHNATVHTYVEGICASAATLIAMAGDERHMSNSGLFMIHLPSGSFRGNRMDLDKGKEVLEKVEDVIRMTYQEKTNLSDEQLTAMLEHETWLTAEEAYAYGFITDIEKEPEDEIDKLMNEIKENYFVVNGVSYNFAAYADPTQLRDKLTEIVANNKGGKAMNFEEIMNSLEEADRGTVEAAIRDQVSEATTQLTEQLTETTDSLNQSNTQLEDTRAELEQVKAELSDAKAEIENLKSTGAEDEDEAFLNSLPENAKQAILDARKVAAEALEAKQKLEDEKNYTEFLNKLDAFGELPLQDEHKAALYNISKNNPTEFAKVEELFKVANAAMTSLGEDVGTGAEPVADTDDAWATINNKIDALRKENPEMDYNDAFSAVIRQEPELYAKYRESMD
jgi:ATP-dependent Clp protease protease subunit